jgi:opacity protein-like surface antigen
MKNSASLALAAMLALSGATAASAASHMSARSERTPGASDTLTLSGDQQSTIWNDVSRHAANQSAPQDFNAQIGAAVPSSISTYPLPRKAARDVPAVRPYRYAMTRDKVLIVNPSDHKIADVVSKVPRRT